jgi:hypothetical protein
MASGSDSADADLGVIAASAASGLSGGLVIIAAGLTLLLGAQTLDMLRGAVPLMVGSSLLLLGASNVVLGWNIRKVRGWAAQAACVLAGLAALAALVWAVLLIMNGFFSLLACAIVPVNIASAAAAFVRIAPGKIADAARRRLEEQGLDVGT